VIDGGLLVVQVSVDWLETMGRPLRVATAWMTSVIEAVSV
jgi:hypothetical protein